MAPNRKIFALKRIKLQGKDSEASRGFVDEITLLQRLRGKPNIIQLIDAEVSTSLTCCMPDAYVKVLGCGPVSHPGTFNVSCLQCLMLDACWLKRTAALCHSAPNLAKYHSRAVICIRSIGDILSAKCCVEWCTSQNLSAVCSLLQLSWLRRRHRDVLTRAMCNATGDSGRGFDIHGIRVWGH